MQDWANAASAAVSSQYNEVGQYIGINDSLEEFEIYEADKNSDFIRKAGPKNVENTQKSLDFLSIDPSKDFCKFNMGSDDDQLIYSFCEDEKSLNTAKAVTQNNRSRLYVEVENDLTPMSVSVNQIKVESLNETGGDCSFRKNSDILD